MTAIVHTGDCREFMRTVADGTYDSVITDPPYELGFMGKKWDASGIAFSVDLWREVLRVAKPGAFLLAFGGTRTYHRMACAIEDAGWEMRDCMMWLYGQGFPKSLDISMAIDKMDAVEEQTERRHRFTRWVVSCGVTAEQINNSTGTFMGHHYTTHPTQPAVMTREHLEMCRHLFVDIPEWVERECDIRSIESKNYAEREVVGSKMSGICNREEGKRHTVGASESVVVDVTAPSTDSAKLWNGWGTALKPAYEPIIVAMKPVDGTFAHNAVTHGVAGINIDGCRVNLPSGQGREQQQGRDGATGSVPICGPRNGGKTYPVEQGRFPANVILDEEAGAMLDEQAPSTGAFAPVRSGHDGSSRGIYGDYAQRGDDGATFHGDGLAGASRFFYCAKASRSEREDGCDSLASHKKVYNGKSEHSAGKKIGSVEDKFSTSPSRNHHPTVKPVSLMQYLARLTKTPTGGVVFDPFTGSGTTGVACVNEWRDFVGCEMTPEYADIARARIQHAIDKRGMI